MKRSYVLGVVIVGALLFTVALTSCEDDGDGTPSPEETSAADRATAAEETASSEEATPAEIEAQRAAEAAVIKLEDLLTGWVETEPSDEGADPCGTHEIVREREVARAVSMDFERDDSLFSNSVVVFPDRRSADDVISAVIDRWRACDPEDMLKVLSEDGSSEDVTFEEAEVGRLSFPAFADRSEALRLTITMSGESAPGDEMTVDIPYDFVFIRSGRMVSLVSAVELKVFSLGDGVSQEMAELSARKLEEAAGTLGP